MDNDELFFDPDEEDSPDQSMKTGKKIKITELEPLRTALFFGDNKNG